MKSKIEYNECKTCKANKGRAGLLINDECMNCYDTRENKEITLYMTLARTEIEIGRTMNILTKQ